jgi:hypothetical protein
MAFDAVAKILAGQPVPKRIVVEDRLFEQERARDELPNRKY